MTKNEDRIQDWRSTGRRKARRALYEAYVEYKCAGYVQDGKVVPCGLTSIFPPKDAPAWFEDIWPLEGRELISSLQADHETKDLTQNSIEHLNWRCVSCHKRQDMQTGKGEQTTEVQEYW